MTPDPPAEPEFAAADPGHAAAAGLGDETPAGLGTQTPAGLGDETPAALGTQTPAALGTQTPAALGTQTPVGLGTETAPTPLAGSPQELYELGGRLLESGDAAGAAEAFGLALERAGAGHPGRGQLLGGLGIARLEQARAVFADAAQCGDASVRPLAVELLARVLALRDRDDEAALVWQRGVSDRDPDVAAAVRARLRRGLGADAESAPVFWWDGFMESAVCHGTLPELANELFGALDHIYALVAVPYARQARERELWEALAEAVRVPSGYAWGPDLHDSFRDRLRDVIGAESDVLPPEWPETG